jgi:hypothetical protein
MMSAPSASSLSATATSPTDMSRRFACSSYSRPSRSTMAPIKSQITISAGSISASHEGMLRLDLLRSPRYLDIFTFQPVVAMG